MFVAQKWVLTLYAHIWTPYLQEATNLVADYTCAGIRETLSTIDLDSSHDKCQS